MQNGRDCMSTKSLTPVSRALCALVGVLRFLRYLIAAVALTATMFGADPTFTQTVDVKDRHGISVLIISNITLFRRSAPVFQGVVKNVSGHLLSSFIPDNSPTLNGTVHKKDGSAVQFPLTLPYTCGVPGIEEKVIYRFPKPWPFSVASDVVSLEFWFPSSWQSPEDERIASENIRKPLEDLKRAIAEQNAKECALIYGNTADKKVSELTVKEEQGVRRCQGLRMYPPY